MAIEVQLPCDGEGVCMRCKVKPPTEECLACDTCATPWHAQCLSSPPQSLASTAQWKCPDCSGDVDPAPVSGIAGIGSDGSGLVAAIRAIEADVSLTEAQKAKKRQQLMSGKAEEDEDEKKNGKGDDRDDDVVAAVEGNFDCSICIQMLQRPVTVRSLSHTMDLGLALLSWVFVTNRLYTSFACDYVNVMYTLCFS